MSTSLLFNQSRPSADSIPLALAYPPVRVKVSARVQQCAQTQEWITDRGMSTCASHKSPPSVRTLAWLGRSYCFLRRLLVHWVFMASRNVARGPSGPREMKKRETKQRSRWPYRLLSQRNPAYLVKSQRKIISLHLYVVWLPWLNLVRFCGSV